MDFKEQLRELKIHFKVLTNKELAEKIGLSEDGVRNWVRKKEIPKKYKKYIENQVNGNNNTVINKAHGTINIGHNSNTNHEDEILELYKSLNDKQKEYIYHWMKSEKIKNEM